MGCNLNVWRPAIIAAGMSILAFLVVVFVLERGHRATDPSREIMLKYKVSVHNDTNIPIQNGGLNISAPLGLTHFQKCVSVNANQPFQLLTTHTGEQSLRVEWGIVPPHALKIVTIETRVLVADEAARSSLSDMEAEAFMNAERYIESEHESIRILSNNLRGESKLRSAQNYYKWINENIVYTGYAKNPRGALYALKYGKGDCTEFSSLFVALCRAGGIPARMMGGFVCPNNMVLELGTYHNWAEFYFDGKWRIADPQRGRFMQEQNSYVAFRFINTMNGKGSPLVFDITGKGLRVVLH